MSLFAVKVDLVWNKEKITNYLALLAKYQIKIIFTSLLNLKQEEWENLELLSNLAKKHQIVIYGEVNRTLLAELNLQYKKSKELIAFFISKGLSGVRVTQDIDFSLQAKLTHNNSQFKVIINGSYNIMQLEQLILGHRINNSNVISCYNAYQQRYSAAAIDFYLINQYESHINNIPFAAFVSSPEKDAALSLELHRDWALVTQIHHLIALGTDIIIVNQMMQEKDLMMLQSIDQKRVTLVVKLEANISEQEKTILFDAKNHFVRPDLAQDVIRSTKVQEEYQELVIISKKTKIDYFEIGDVVILNQDAKNDMRELQIITKRIKNDSIRNLVAKIAEPYLTYFLSELKATRDFKFTI